MKRTIITTSWDDGHPLDLKLAKMLRKHNIPATFYIPINPAKWKPLSHLEIREIAKDFDIGGHTLHHLDLTKIPSGRAEKEIQGCKTELEELIGREVEVFSYPKGAYNAEIVEMVKKAGFKGARVTSFLQMNLTDYFRIGTTLCASPNSLSGKRRALLFCTLARNYRLLRCFVKNLPIKLFSSWNEVAGATLDYVVKFGGIWHLWGHAWEIEKYDNWERLEKLFERIGEISQTRNVSLMSNSQVVSQTVEE